VSRAYKARQKARRQHARTAGEGGTDARRSQPRQLRRLIALMPAVVIAAILATAGILGFGGSSGSDREQIQQKVAALLSGIPQHGTTLGSPKAPITLWVFADLECPTVKRFVTAYLPSVIKTWVRDGAVKLEYRSLETDTYNEKTFFEQEAAALAAGRQGKMWNYALTFIHEQGQKHTNYATDEFLADIASQVPGLHSTRWQHDREDPLLTKQVARELHSASIKKLQFTPSFLLGFSGKAGGHTRSEGTDAVREDLESSLSAAIQTLGEEASGDVPTLGVLEDQNQILGEIGKH
jgi:protein-disulfide isomerase